MDNMVFSLRTLYCYVITIQTSLVHKFRSQFRTYPSHDSWIHKVTDCGTNQREGLAPHSIPPYSYTFLIFKLNKHIKSFFLLFLAFSATFILIKRSLKFLKDSIQFKLGKERKKGESLLHLRFPMLLGFFYWEIEDYKGILAICSFMCPVLHSHVSSYIQ